MAFEGAAADRSMDWPAPAEADWDAIYAEHLPRIYNYFRFRLAADADVEDLTARVFELDVGGPYTPPACGAEKQSG
jgi:hypothetical protein